MMALASKLEGIDTYHVYAQDGNADLWRQIAEDDRRHADLLFAELKSRLAGAEPPRTRGPLDPQEYDLGSEHGSAPWNRP